jgi:C_GCAxxG_C_C family probable redox protein
MGKAEEAIAIFKGGCNCSQSVLSVFAGEFGLDKMTVLKIASGFGGGIGHMGQTCGAVSGAVMVIGLKNNMAPEKTFDFNSNNYAVIGRLVEEFKKRNGTVVCRDLIGFDFSDAEAYRKARKEGLFFTVCPKLISDAVQILEEIYK